MWRKKKKTEERKTISNLIYSHSLFVASKRHNDSRWLKWKLSWSLKKRHGLFGSLLFRTREHRRFLNDRSIRMLVFFVPWINSRIRFSLIIVVGCNQFLNKLIVAAYVFFVADCYCYDDHLFIYIFIYK